MEPKHTSTTYKTYSTASVVPVGPSSRPQTAQTVATTTDATHVSPPAISSPKTPIYPEGGAVAWFNVLGAFLLQMCCFGYSTSFGVYQDYYTRVYLKDESSSAISWIGSINVFLVISSGVLFGHLFDRGYFYYLIYGGSILISFSLFMLSLAKPGAYYQIFLSQGIGSGLGGGIMYIPTIAVVSQYFHVRRPLALTIVAAGSSLGAVVHPIMLNNTLDRLGFAVAARANAGLVSGLLLVGCAMMRLRTKPNPQHAGLSLWKAAKKFSKDAPYVFTSLGMTIFIVAFYFPLFYLQLDALSHGLSRTFSFYALVIMNVSSFVGRLSPGFFAGRLGVENMTLASTVACTVLMLGMIGLRSVASVVVMGVIYGFFAGIYIALLAPLISLLTDDMSEIGARLGISLFFCGLGSLIGTPIDGALLTRDFIWWRPALFSGLVGLLGSACYGTALVLLRRQRARDRSLTGSEMGDEKVGKAEVNVA